MQNSLDRECHLEAHMQNPHNRKCHLDAQMQNSATGHALWGSKCRILHSRNAEFLQGRMPFEASNAEFLRREMPFRGLNAEFCILGKCTMQNRQSGGCVFLFSEAAWLASRPPGWGVPTPVKIWPAIKATGALAPPGSNKHKHKLKFKNKHIHKNAG